MSKPEFQITSESVIYTNELTPLAVSSLSSTEYSTSYYLWNFGDGTYASGENATHVYDTVGDYNVTLSRYLSSGEVVASDTQVVEAINLIPNAMDWAEDSFKSPSVTASVKNVTPFIVNTYSSYQEYDEDSCITLYAENSKSIPFDFSDKRIHLKPNWRFFDEDDNNVTQISIEQTKIYAIITDLGIKISAVESVDSLFVGTSSQTSFYFVDDSPSGVDPDVEYLPTTIVVSHNLSSFRDEANTLDSIVRYPALTQSLFIDNVVPAALIITSNGVFDIPYLKFSNTKIPFNIRIIDSNGNFIKTHPTESLSVSSYEMDIGFIGDIDISESTPLTGAYLSRFKTDFSSLGGFYESYFIPTSSTSSSVVMSSSVLLDYSLNDTPTRYGVFSDENSNNIYRVSFIEGQSETYTRKPSDVIGNEFDGNTSNKFGTAVDFNYDLYFLDSDDSRLEAYDSSFVLTDSVELSGDAEIIDGHTSPAQICFDEGNGKFITLHDAPFVLYVDPVDNNDITSIPLLDAIPDSVVLDEFGEPVVDGVPSEYTLDGEAGGLLYSPTAIEILSDNDTMYISFTESDNLSGNYIEKYSIDRTSTIALSSIATIQTDTSQTVDMVSNRDGSILYTLNVDYLDNRGYIDVYDISLDTLLSSVFVGYDPEFITIDTDQTAWTISKELSSSTSYNHIVKVNDTGAKTIYDYDGFGNNHIGGIAGDSSGKIWLINSEEDHVMIFNKDDIEDQTFITIAEDVGNDSNVYVAYGDWNGFRWYNKFGFDGTSIIYDLSGQSNEFIINDTGKYNLQKINEDFDMTETVKSYRTTDAMLEYDHLFDDFLGSIFGNKYDDGTFFGRNVYEKIANFVMNHTDVETCSVDALHSLCDETGVDFNTDIVYPRDVKRLVDLFSIKFKKLWGDDYQTGVIEDYKGEPIDIASYVVSADPQIKIIATERFNDFNTIITPILMNFVTPNYVLYDVLSVVYGDKIVVEGEGEIDEGGAYPLSSYNSTWGWGLSVPPDGNVEDYYDFFELNTLDSTRQKSVIDWDNELTDTSIKPISSYENYMNETGIVSVSLGDKLRKGLDLYL
tara:strand:- start:17206 stop:20415 length:3210 start_codon:yes stop_codon:yes gene_type:complete